MADIIKNDGSITKTDKKGKIITNISTRGKGNKDIPTAAPARKDKGSSTSGNVLTNQAEIQERITAAIIKQLEEGKVPWRKGWNTSGLMPSNLVSGKPYSGINSLLLGMMVDEESYSSPYWLTYKQAQDLGGSVKKGEKGTLITYYRKLIKEEKETNEPKGETTLRELPSSFSLLKSFVVFNADQCKDIPIPETVTREPVDVLAELEKITTGWNCPPIHYKSSPKAAYIPTLDEINMPPLNAFASANEHAYTLTHELIHSTGHESRLNRWVGENLRFGCSDYAKEELVAEIGACMALSMVGIDVDIQNSGAYVNNWLQALKDDRTLVFTAASKASKAANLIVGNNQVEADELLSTEA